MPLYEEKLISPLALRFTQDHIRTTFRDGRIVEDSIEQISSEPCSEGNYDVILRAPFPMIEIIRWHPPRRIVGGKRKEDHWFTLDNRRLYCLQRAAAAHWPKRVAAVVAIFYADPGAVFKKYDSSTLGQAVSISHSVKDAPISWWDWRDEISSNGNQACASAANACVLADDDKDKFDDLDTADQPAGPPAMNDALLRALAVDGGEPTVVDKRSFENPVVQTGMSDALLRALALDDATVQEPSHAPTGVLGDGHCCATPSTALASSDDSSDTASAVSTAGPAAIVASLLEEVERQLATPGNDGRVWVEKWNERYRSQLGSLKQFLESHPDRFCVVAGKGKHFTVQLASESGRRQSSNRQRRRPNAVLQHLEKPNYRY